MAVDTASNVSGFSSILQENKNQIARIKEYEKSPVKVTPRNLLFAGTALGGLFIVGLMATTIISGAVALVTAAVAGGLLYYGSRVLKRMDPVIKQKLKNKQVEMMIEEARKNAIYQLDNQVLENQRRLEQGRTARDKVAAQIRKLEGQVDPDKEGTANHKRKVEMISTIKDAYDQICINIDKGAMANKAFEQKVKEYKEMDRFAKEAGAAMAMLNQAGGDKFQEMLSLEAFDEIETDFNEALVNIENHARDMAIDAE